MMNRNCIIVAEKLAKRYGEFIAVDKISFCVKRGEIFGLLGPNGAGKTTIIRMLCCLTKITSGKAIIYGYNVIQNCKEIKKLIGVVPDQANLYSELTCLENLLFCGEMYGIPRKERLERAEELLRFFGLWEKRDAKFKDLSRGLKKRLTIAAALIHNPKVLFMDEPTSGLDIMSKRILWSKLLELSRKGLTVLLTTHNIREAFEICSRIAIINKGKIIAMGRPWELRSTFSAEGVIETLFHPRNPDVEELVNLPGVVKVYEKQGLLRIITSDTIATLEGLAKYARSKGFDIYTLSVRGIDAEELFIKIVGGTNVQ